MCYVYFSMWKFQIIYFYNMYTLSPFWGFFFSWRHTRTILGRPIWICYLTAHANSRFFFNFRFFFYCIRCFERWPIFGGKIRCVFYPAAKKTEIQGMRKKSTPVEVLFTFRRRIVCRCATKYENSHWLKTHRKWKDPMYKTDNYVDVDNKQ